MHKAMKNWLAIVAVAGLALTLGVSTVLATSGTGTQNSDLTISVSASPDVLTVGDSATISGSVTNNTNKSQKVTIKGVLTLPDGTKYTESRTVTLAAGQSESVSGS